MSFTRTLWGLANLHSFYGVDIVVYLEGGEHSYSYQQALSGSHNDQSVDILFWQKMFRLFLPDKKIKYLPVGSKSTLTKIAETIQHANFSHVCVAMDRDFDNVKGTIIFCPGVLYTYGYGWENDVLVKPVLKDIFVSMCSASLYDTKYVQEIDSSCENLLSALRWPVYADILLSYHGSSFFPRDTPLRQLLRFDAGKPSIDMSKMRKMIKLARKKHSGKLLFGKKIQFQPLVDCYCHLFSTYCFELLLHMLKKHGKPPSPHATYSAATDHFVRQITRKHLKTYHDHYETQFHMIP